MYDVLMNPAVTKREFIEKVNLECRKLKISNPTWQHKGSIVSVKSIMRT